MVQMQSQAARTAFGTGRRVALVGIALLATVSATSVASVAQATATPAAGAHASPEHPAGTPNLGPNVIVFTPSESQAQIQSTVDAIDAQQQGNQFGTQRYALLFEPGTYGSATDPLIFQVGYYTEVAGLGESPTGVTINGAIDVVNQCTTTDGTQSCDALDNFWRSMSNLTINIAAQSGCQTGADFWAVSQAAPLRRVNFTGGNVSLQDYCTAGPQFASGGFIADSAFAGGTIISGSQQQFIVRNSSLDGWTNGVWNQVFAGDIGAPAQSFPSPPYTTLATNPVSREVPYLYIDGKGKWNVFVPSAQHNTTGTTWQQGQTPGHSLPIRDFFIASPSDSVHTINNALADGKNLIVTPGVYNIGQTIRIQRANTIVLGMGIATLTAEHGAVPMRVGNVKGVDISGLTFDAGPVNSPVLLQVGTRTHNKGHGRRHGRHHKRTSSKADPTAIQDVFFRIGGPHVGKATESLQVNSNNTLLDDIWAWRADHGTGVGWTVNTARNGVVVTGNHVTATGLFVEHYQKYDVIWRGQHGETIFFQNEMPYDPPNQAAWEHHGILGWAAYKIGNNVKTHQGWGLGSYIFTNVDPSLHASHAFEVPDTPGVQLHDLLTVSLNGAGTIDHVVNDVGTPVTPTVQGPSDVVSYP
jgi:hypothetical protein